MKTVHAIFENGIFRPTEAIQLPEKSVVEFEPRLIAASGADDHLDRVYVILSQSFDSEQSDLAARHDEHQP
jgi:predicted DNA-binding antitoxin AbrB/MazE fold protein